MKNEKDWFEKIEDVLKKLAWLVVAFSGFGIFTMFAVKHLVDYWKLLW
jgi:hypothetical protein